MVYKYKACLMIVLLAILAGTVFADSESVLNYLSVNPNPIYKHAMITLSFLEKVNVDVVIETEDGTIIKTIYSGDLNIGTFNFFWNRLDDNGEFVPNGQYCLAVHYDTRYTSTKKTIILK